MTGQEAPLRLLGAWNWTTWGLELGAEMALEAQEVTNLSSGLTVSTGGSNALLELANGLELASGEGNGCQ